ncbi:LOW QUALITY PROTEIN: PIF1-like protein, partial [Mya arenaria]
MRQKDDVSYAELLNRVREGNHTSSDMAILESKVIKLENKQTLSTMLHLFTINDKVNEHNDAYLQTLDTDGCTSIAVDYTIGDVTARANSTVLSIAKDLPPQKTQNLLLLLQIKVFRPLYVNIDTSDGLTNGARGILKHFESSNAKPHTLWVQFTDIYIGKRAREQNKNLIKQIIDNTWTPIIVVDRQFQVVVRRQFPLKPAAAMTIHKAQGMSMPEVAVSFQGRVQTHMVYVALTRVTSLLGLYLLDLNSKKITVDKKVVEEMRRLRKDRQMSPVPEPP